jgi:hypothetical protein
MSITLSRFANGDTNYVSKHSGNADTIEAAINALQNQVASAASALFSPPYDVGSFIEAAPTASQVVLRHVFARSVVFAAGLAPSQGKAGTAATGSTTFTIKKNGSSVGSFNFASSAMTATFSMASQTTFAAGDVMTVEAPGTPDATLAMITFTLAGTR